MSQAALGDLVVRLAADIANFELSMTRAEQLTNRTADAIDSSMDKAVDAVKKLTEAYIGFEALKGFAEHVDEATKFASSLELLSQRLGVSASDLSSFKDVAEKSGTSIDVVAQGLSVLGKSMYDTMQGTGKAKVAFDSLHLSVTNSNGTLKDAKQFFVELSDKLAGLASATERNAVAQKTMRGVGSELVPLMLALAQGAELHKEITDQQAISAKHYTDALVDLHNVQEGFFRMVSQQTTPVLEALVRAYVDLSTGAGGLNEKTKQLAAQNTIKQWAVDGGIAITMVVDGLRYVVVGFQIVTDAVKILAESAIVGFQIIVGAVGTAFASLQDVGTLIRGIGELLSGDLVAGIADINASFASMKSGWGGFFDDAKAKAKGLSMNVDGLAGDIEKLMAGFKQGAATEAFLSALDAINQRVDKVKKGTGGAGDAVSQFKHDAVDSLIAALDKEEAALDANIENLTLYGVALKSTKEAEVLAKFNEQDWINTMEKEYATRHKAGQSLEDYIHQVQTNIVLEARDIDQKHQLVDILTRKAAADAASADAMGKAVQSIQDQIERQKEANATFGGAVDAVAQYNIALLENRKRIAEQYDASQEVVAALDAQIAKWKGLASAQVTGKSIQDQVDGWKDLASTIGDTASKMLMDWGHSVSTLRDMVKSMIADFIKLFAQKFVLNMVASFVGGGTGSALSSQAAQLGNGSFVGNIYNAFMGGGNAAAATAGTPGGGGFQPDGSFSDVPQYGQSGGMGMMGAAGTGLFTGLALGGVQAQLYGNNRNQTGISVGSAVGGVIGGVVGSIIPVIGTYIGAMIGSVLGGLIGSLFKSGGGQKSQGFASGTFSGNALGGTRIGDATLDGLFTGNNEGQAAATAVVQGLADNFYKTVGLLGGKNAPNMQFGFGTSSDPKGTAPGMIHTFLRDASGNIIYQNNNDNASRDPTTFQEQATLAAEQTLVAGLQHVDLGPELNDLFKSFGDVTSSTKDDLDALLAKAQDLHTALVTLDALGKGSFGINISLDDLKQYQQAGETLTDTANRVGGAWVNLVSQFESPMEKLNDEKTNLGTLFSTLTASGYQIPKTRDEYLNLMKGIDQSTDAGRTLFLQMLQLAPAFNDVTAASESMLQQFDQYMGAHRAGYSAGQAQSQFNGDITQLQSNSAFAGMSAESIMNTLHNMTRDDFAKFDTATQQLILTLLGLDDAIKGNTSATANNTTTLQQTVDLSAYGSDAYNSAFSKYSSGFDTRFGETINNAPDTSTKLGIQIGAENDYIKELMGRQKAIEAQSNGYALPQEWYAIQAVIDNMQAGLPGLTAGLARVTVLESQYGKQKGDQLYDLENWYNQQKALVAGNNTAMAALEQEYQDKRKAIITGGVADATNGLQQWQTGIQSFLNGLLTNQQLSPLSLQDQLSQAGTTFEDTLTKANSGDTDAQNNLQSAAETYLNIARQFGASGPLYNDIFRKVYDELAGASKAPTYEDKMAAAIPEGKLASSNDIAGLRADVAGLTAVLASGISVSDPGAQAALDKIASKLANGSGVLV
jgi:hypothetical protein